MHDVRPDEYARVIRDLIWRENDVTNHRLMWLLVVQGLLANAFVSRQILIAGVGIATGGILVALSAFVVLYKSYHARAYLRFLGNTAKQGRLPEEHLPIDGWPRKRIQDWRKPLWVCPWLERAGDVLEPYLFLPGLIIFLWVVVVLRLFGQSLETCVGVGVCLTPVTLFTFCVFWVWSERAYEQERPFEPGQSRDDAGPGEADRRTPRSAA
jgi:hypothetical protein